MRHQLLLRIDWCTCLWAAASACCGPLSHAWPCCNRCASPTLPQHLSYQVRPEGSWQGSCTAACILWPRPSFRLLSTAPKQDLSYDVRPEGSQVCVLLPYDGHLCIK